MIVKYIVPIIAYFFRMYQDKLSNLKKQLDELKHGNHSEYLRRIKKLESQLKERIRLNDIYREYLMECVEKDYVTEKKAAIKEYEEKKNDLKENLLTDFEEKRKIIESERHTMELTGDCTEIKPTITRKLRRRPNEPIPVAAEKRRKTPSGQLILLLDEKEVENDLKLISRGKALTPIRRVSMTSNGIPTSPLENYQMVETKIEDGKLLLQPTAYKRYRCVHLQPSHSRAERP